MACSRAAPITISTDDRTFARFVYLPGIIGPQFPETLSEFHRENLQHIK